MLYMVQYSYTYYHVTVLYHLYSSFHYLAYYAWHLLYMRTPSNPNTHIVKHTHKHSTLVIILCVSSTHRKISKPTTGAAENRTRTNPYLTPTNTAGANRHPNKEIIELESCEELYQDVN